MAEQDNIRKRKMMIKTNKSSLGYKNLSQTHTHTKATSRPPAPPQTAAMAFPSLFSVLKNVHKQQQQQQ